jgi:hypothetical protein
MKKQKLKELVEEFGQKYSDILGIDLSGREDHDFQMVSGIRTLRSTYN